jgi:hypothetical protein
MTENKPPDDTASLEWLRFIGTLFFRRLRGRLDQADQQALESWLGEQSPESRQFFGEMEEWEQIKKALQFLYAVDRSAALAEVHKQIRRAPVKWVSILTHLFHLRI